MIKWNHTGKDNLCACLPEWVCLHLVGDPSTECNPLDNKGESQMGVRVEVRWMEDSCVVASFLIDIFLLFCSVLFCSVLFCSVLLSNLLDYSSVLHHYAQIFRRHIPPYHTLTMILIPFVTVIIPITTNKIALNRGQTINCFWKFQ